LGENLEGLQKGATRLTITIDRQDMSCTCSQLFAPSTEKLREPPPSAWVEVNYS